MFLSGHVHRLGSITMNRSMGAREAYHEDENAKSKHVYDSVVGPMVRSCLEGCNGFVLVYGQTGTEKTHTMKP